jgi:hypothetical protein
LVKDAQKQYDRHGLVGGVEPINIPSIFPNVDASTGWADSADDVRFTEVTGRLISPSFVFVRREPFSEASDAALLRRAQSRDSVLLSYCY